MKRSSLLPSAIAFTSLLQPCTCKIDRQKIVSQFNPYRNASNLVTPMQVGNGNFAFGADITGLQAVLPYNILSSWGWHNNSLPTAPNQTQPSDFTGLDWYTHGRLVNYAQPNPAEPLISQWMIGNPNRMNLGRVGLFYEGAEFNESALSSKSQYTDLYSGGIYSQFTLGGEVVNVQTFVHPGSSSVGVQIQSNLINSGKLSVFFDYPYADYTNKFEDPFVGLYNAVSNHSTTLTTSGSTGQVEHSLDATTYYNTITWESSASMSGPLANTHRYTLQPQSSNGTFSFVSAYSPGKHPAPLTFSTIKSTSTNWWKNYWEDGAFIDLTGTKNGHAANATELQRRIILSQYLLAVNEAGDLPPQESGLCNNGWYGKFHMEQVFWHLAHWGRWGRWSLLRRSVPRVYQKFLPTSLERAQLQGYAGARWGKESDPTGRSAPGEINSLLIWQQPHPMYFAEMEYRAFPTSATLQKWDNLLVQSANFMASYAFYNTSTGVYDLGPPMYPVSENTNPNATINPTFELAYWRYGLSIAAEWQKRQGKQVPKAWTTVEHNLAPLPIENGTYVIYEGIPNMWNTTAYDEDHPAMLGLQGWLPPPPNLNHAVLEATRQRVYQTWNLTYSYPWDLSVLSMNAVRMGHPRTAMNFLLHPTFQFDDIGMPIGGTRVPTPYFPNSASMLFALAMIAGGWDGNPGMHFPKEWTVVAEGFTPSM